MRSRIQFRITAYFDLSVIHPEGRKIFPQSLRRTTAGWEDSCSSIKDERIDGRWHASFRLQINSRQCSCGLRRGGKNQARQRGFPSWTGAIWTYSLSDLRATISSGSGIFSLLLNKSWAKTARICSIRTATSRPFFTSASVTTAKWSELTRIQWDSFSSGSFWREAKRLVHDRQSRRPKKRSSQEDKVAKDHDDEIKLSTLKKMLPRRRKRRD